MSFVFKKQIIIILNCIQYDALSAEWLVWLTISIGLTFTFQLGVGVVKKSKKEEQDLFIMSNAAIIAIILLHLSCCTVPEECRHSKFVHFYFIYLILLGIQPQFEDSLINDVVNFTCDNINSTASKMRNDYSNCFSGNNSKCSAICTHYNNADLGSMRNLLIPVTCIDNEAVIMECAFFIDKDDPYCSILISLLQASKS